MQDPLLGAFINLISKYENPIWGFQYSALPGGGEHIKPLSAPHFPDGETGVKGSHLPRGQTGRSQTQAAQTQLCFLGHLPRLHLFYTVLKQWQTRPWELLLPLDVFMINYISVIDW